MTNHPNNKHYSDKNKSSYFAEILESNITTWKAESWQWDTIPEFGSLIIASSDDRTLFGIVYDITTGPIDPIRQPIAYQKTQEELKHEQPQIFEFLKTSFSCISIGYQEGNHFFYNLPPKPLKIHTFVRYANNQEYNICFDSEQFLHLIYNTHEQINKDELLLAIIKHQLHHHALTKTKLNKLIESFFMLNKNNYLQTKMFLPRLQLILQTNPEWQKLSL